MEKLGSVLPPMMRGSALPALADRSTGRASVQLPVGSACRSGEAWDSSAAAGRSAWWSTGSGAAALHQPLMQPLFTVMLPLVWAEQTKRVTEEEAGRDWEVVGGRNGCSRFTFRAGRGGGGAWGGRLGILLGAGAGCTGQRSRESG